MSLRAGATLYYRVLDSQREFWIVDGHPLHENEPKYDPDMIWKVKRDKSSGRFFFVNLGVHGKKWRLPDIYDPRFHEEAFAATQSGVVPRAKSPPRHQHQHQHQQHEYGSPGTPPPSLHQHQHQNYPSSYETSRKTHSHAGTAVNYQQQHPSTNSQSHKTTTGTTQEAPGATTSSGFDMYDYGSDLLNASPLRKEEELRRKQLEEDRRVEERRREELAMMQQNFYNNNNQQQQSFHGGGGNTNPRYYDLSSQAEQELTRHSAEVHRQVQETRRLEDSVSRQRERNNELLDREMEMTSELERRQLHNIEEHANALQHKIDTMRSVSGGVNGTASQAPQTPVPNMTTNSRSTSLYHQPPSATAAVSPQPHIHSHQHHVGSSQSVVSGIAPSPSIAPTSTIDPLSILQDQLDLERKRNEELKRQVSERDRIILGNQLSEVERERRDMNFRLKMLEAMAAFRKRRGVYEADSGIKADNRHQMLQREAF